MYLFLSSQDILTLDICIIDKNEVVRHAHIETPPELFLSVLDNQIRLWDVSLDELEGVVVVVGPGSFTSSRLSVTIANAISYRYAIPVIALENPNKVAIERLVNSIDYSKAKKEFAVPVYDRPPHIT